MIVNQWMMLKKFEWLRFKGYMTFYDCII